MEQPTLSMAMTAWSAKVSRSFICAGVNGQHRRSQARLRAPKRQIPLLTKGSGTKKERKLPRHDTQRWKIVLRADVGNVERPILAHPAQRVERRCSPSSRPNGTEPKLARDNQNVFPSWSRSATSSIPANPGGALDYGVKHRLYVGWRPADDS